MPLQMNFEDRFGNQNEESYWEINSFLFNNKAHRAVAIFHGWKNKGAYLAGKEPIGEKMVEVDKKEDYMRLAAIVGPLIAPVIYEEAMKDVFFKNK